MENISILEEVISTMGFPIVVCGVLFWYIWKTQKAHTEEVDKLRESIDNNTIILTKLLERLDNEYTASTI